jgi:hypothetical protein
MKLDEGDGEPAAGVGVSGVPVDMAVRVGVGTIVVRDGGFVLSGRTTVLTGPNVRDGGTGLGRGSTGMVRVGRGSTTTSVGVNVGIRVTGAGVIVRGGFTSGVGVAVFVAALVGVKGTVGTTVGVADAGGVFVELGVGDWIGGAQNGGKHPGVGVLGTGVVDPLVGVGDAVRVGDGPGVALAAAVGEKVGLGVGHLNSLTTGWTSGPPKLRDSPAYPRSDARNAWYGRAVSHCEVVFPGSTPQPLYAMMAQLVST